MDQSRYVVQPSTGFGVMSCGVTWGIARLWCAPPISYLTGHVIRCVARVSVLL
jgi:hypothetical protein